MVVQLLTFSIELFNILLYIFLVIRFLYVDIVEEQGWVLQGSANSYFQVLSFFLNICKLIFFFFFVQCLFKTYQT